MRRLYLVLSFSGSNNATLVLNRCELPKASKVANQCNINRLSENVCVSNIESKSCLYQVSAKTGYNVNELFEDIASKLAGVDLERFVSKSVKNRKNCWQTILGYCC